MLLFSLALGIRLLYQHEAVVDNPIRADAGKYLSASYNLRQFGVYSLAPPVRANFAKYRVSRDNLKKKSIRNLDVYPMRLRKSGLPPHSRTDLSPGYPVFLSLFWRANDANGTLDFLLGRVLKVQAVMGALTVVLTFVIARSCLSLPWAVLAGVFTALSPHLVVMDGYLLTESLFTFVMVLGSLSLVLSWSTNRWIYTIIAGIFLAFSARVRAINFLFMFFLAPVFFFNARNNLCSSKLHWIKHMLLLLVGFGFIAGAFHVFTLHTVTDGGTKEAPQHYVRFKKVLETGLKGVHPSSSSEKEDRYSRRSTSKSDSKDSFIDRFLKRPISYVTWNLGRLGNIFVTWCWHNKYHDDIYIYPMKRGGFHANLFLRLIYGTMRFFHWPLYLLTLVAPIMFYKHWRQGTLAVESRTLLVPVLGFVYFPLVLTLLSSNLPRYAIPARPFSYILAAASLSWLIQSHTRHSSS